MVRARGARARTLVIGAVARAAPRPRPGRWPGRAARGRPPRRRRRIGSTRRPSRPSPPSVLVLGALVPGSGRTLALEALRARAPPSSRSCGCGLVGAPLGGAAGELSARAARPRRRARPGGRASSSSARSPTSPASWRARRACCTAPTREPFGLAVLEALAAGRPVVVPAAAGPGRDRRPTRARCRIRPATRAPPRTRSSSSPSDPRARRAHGRRGPRAGAEQFDVADSRARWAVRRRATAAGSGRTRALGGHARDRDGHAQLRAGARRAASVGRAPPARRPGDRRRLRLSRRHGRGRRRSPVARVIALDENVGFGTRVQSRRAPRSRRR